MGEIQVSGSGISQGIAELKALEGELMAYQCELPKLLGSGQTANITVQAAEKFKDLQNKLDILMINSIGFFENVKKSYEAQDKMIAESIKGK